MKLIKPAEISGRIISLLDESDEWVLIVSPYMKISKWYKLINKLNLLETRKIPIEIYVRDDPENERTYRELMKQNLVYKKIPNLHSKFYMNEKQGISTSMNMLLTSEINSLEMGYISETREDYNDMYDYYLRYIRNGEDVSRETLAGQDFADIKGLLHQSLIATSKNKKTFWLWTEGDALHIRSGRNNYRLAVHDGVLVITTRLRISSGFKQKEDFPHKLAIKKIEDLSAMEIKTLAFHPPDLLELRGQEKFSFNSPCISRTLKSEAEIIIESALRFIDAADNLIL